MNLPSSLAPDAILQTAFGFWGSKVLLTAVEFGVFTTLGEHHLTDPQLGSELFTRFKVIHLAGSSSAAIAYK